MKLRILRLSSVVQKINFLSKNNSYCVYIQTVTGSIQFNNVKIMIEIAEQNTHPLVIDWFLFICYHYKNREDHL